MVDDFGIDQAALERYIEEQIYTLPGTDRHREEFSIVLTGSRATACHAPTSDVDIDVLCRQPIYESVLKEAYEAGITKSPNSLGICTRKGDDDWGRYFGKGISWPHFSITPLETAERQFREYEDVPIWIWTNARIIADPNRQFERIRESFQGYPQDVLIGKIKYHWMMDGYWAVEGYPGNHRHDEEFLAAAASVMNGWLEVLRFCFLVEGKPFPYAEKLMHFGLQTKLGKTLGPMIQRSIDLAVGRSEPNLDPWERLDKAIEPMRMQDPGTEGEWFWEVTAKAAIEAGVDEAWINADYDNLDELLSGSLGPPP
jgi:hypothetical protein